MPAARRARAAFALAIAAVLVLATLAMVWTDAASVVLGLAGVLLLLGGTASALTRQMPRRAVGLVQLAVGLLLLVLALMRATDSGIGVVVRLLAVAAMTMLAVGTARAALAGHEEPHAPDPHRGPRAPSRPVLLCNEQSGGGKVADSDLLARAHALGVETVALGPDSDLTELARQAVADGADCLGVAGGDGSIALVAAVACEAGVPLVCVPAGTRNHFARDLGIDCADPAAALQAFVSGRRRRVDIGRVGDRAFVNNVSVGAYASLVQSDDYRDSNLATSLVQLSSLAASGAGSADVSFETEQGEQVADATVVLVSNNPYILGLTADAATRSTLVGGRLGVLALRAQSGAEAIAAMGNAVLGLPFQGGALVAFDTETLQLRTTQATVDAAVDGEPVTLSAPLTFTIRPAALLLLVPRSAHHRPVSLRRLLLAALGR